MSQDQPKSILRLTWDHLAHLHLALWIVGGIIALATAGGALASHWGYLPILLATLGTFVAGILGLDGIIWLRQQTSFRGTAIIFDKQDKLYMKVNNLYEKKYNGKATFYHYSGTRIHAEVIMLFNNGFDIRLFVENPKTAQELGCTFQQERIASMITQLKNELPGCGPKGRLTIYQSNAPLTVRAALLDDHIVLGWYIYHLLAKPPEGFDEDKLSVWGHDGWGMIIDRRHPVFNSARDFLIEKYEKRICATELWSYGAQRVP